MIDRPEREERDWPDLAGRLVGGGHVLAVRVYYEDTDFSGVVYHAAYLKFMERGRSDFLRLAGVHHHELASGSHGGELVFAVRHMEIDFLGSAKIDDLLEVHTRTLEIRGARLILAQEVRCGDTVLVATTVTVAVVGSDRKPKRVPRSIADQLEHISIK